MKNKTLTLPEDLLQQGEQYKKETGESLSSLIRRLLREFFKKNVKAKN